MNIICSWIGCTTVLGTTDSVRGTWGYICESHTAQAFQALAKNPELSLYDVLELKPQPALQPRQ